MTQLQTKTLAYLRGHIPGFDQLAKGEQVLQGMAYLADVIHVREDLGNNHGTYVDDFLHEAGGLNPGNPWCASVLNWLCEMLGVPNPDVSDGAVIGWKRWAEKNGRLKTSPARGRLCLYLHADATGHIGIVISSDGSVTRSIEGNTSPGTEGSQRDGQGLYRRARPASTWKFYIDLN